MARKINWETEFTKLVDISIRNEFVWGENDCALFVYRAIQTLIDLPMEEAENPDYDDEESAKEFMKEFSGGGVLETAEKLAEKYKLKEVSALKAWRGDVAVVFVDDDYYFAVCIGPYFAVVSKTGFRKFPLTRAVAVWRIE